MASLKLEDGENQCSVYFDDTSDTSYTATATHSHWVNYTVGHGQPPENFAEYTEGNAVLAFLGGKAYYAELLNEFKQAKKSIYITGWQVNWDAQLTEGVRLVDALLEAAINSPQLKIYIMPWKNPVQVQTWAAATERVFAAMNNHEQVKRDAFYVLLADSKSGMMFSHHQKCVVVDEKVAFVGGIDLAYGRYDDHYGLNADADGRQGMNMYNSCIPSITHCEGYNPMDEEVSKGKGQLPAYSVEKTAAAVRSVVLKHQLGQSQGHSHSAVYNDPVTQPRMPWQDYQMRVEGPAVDDLTRNFVLRWNSCRHTKGAHELKTDNPELRLPWIPSGKKGSCQVQVLRSASLTMRQDEHKHMPQATPRPHVKQDDILRAMHQLISKAEHYIYIENQFFISAFGESSVIGDDNELSPVADSINPTISAGATRIMPDDDAPQNPVVEWLGDKLQQIIFSNNPQPFHIYMVLPVHPEGALDTPNIVAQIHLTQQSLVFGSHSLLNRIRRSLWVKQQLEMQAVPRKDWCLWLPELEEMCGEAYQDIEFSECDTYVTLLNLRDHTVLKGMAVTEQIYVHSKLMIVDDRYVLVGSANINDRSLLGDRDSELAVLISDTAHGYTDLDGAGKAAPYRNFARELRKNAWCKWLGIAAYDCIEAMDKPATGWEKIQEIARVNAHAYEQVFNFIPRDDYEIGPAVSTNYRDDKGNESETPKIRVSIWPTLPVNTEVTSADERKMPFSEAFWKYYRRQDNGALSAAVKGYFTVLPIHWTEGENNFIPFNMRLIAENNIPKDGDIQIADNGDKKDTEEGLS